MFYSVCYAVGAWRSGPQLTKALRDLWDDPVNSLAHYCREFCWGSTYVLHVLVTIRYCPGDFQLLLCYLVYRSFYVIGDLCILCSMFYVRNCLCWMGTKEIVRVFCYCIVMKWTVIYIWLKESIWYEVWKCAWKNRGKVLDEISESY